MTERFFMITFPVDLVREPVLYSLVQRHGLEPVVYRASVAGSSGWLALSLSGPDSNIDEAVLELKCRGAQIREGDRTLVDAGEPAAGASLRIRLTIPEDKVAQPIYSKMIKDHDVVINIRQAKILDGAGSVEMEVSGELENIETAIGYLTKNGIRVDPIERDVIE